MQRLLWCEWYSKQGPHTSALVLWLDIWQLVFWLWWIMLLLLSEWWIFLVLFFDGGECLCFSIWLWLISLLLLSNWLIDLNIFVYHRSLLSRFPEEARIAHQCLRQSVVVIIIKNIRISNNHFPPHFYHHHHHINFFLLITTTIGNASVISVSCCLLGPNWSDQYQHSLTVF